jgi:hypothetical protein
MAAMVNSFITKVITMLVAVLVGLRWMDRMFGLQRSRRTSGSNSSARSTKESSSMERSTERSKT